VIVGTTDAAQDISFRPWCCCNDALPSIVLEDPAVLPWGSFIGGGRGQLDS